MTLAAGAALAMAALLPLGAGTSALLGAGTSTSSLAAGTRFEAREVVLVARDMAFYLDGMGDENPTLRFKAGEQVRVVLRNEEPGVTHDFAVREWRVATDALEGPSRDAVTFRVPERPGRYAYLCNPHSAMMRGSIEVE